VIQIVDKKIEKYLQQLYDDNDPVRIEMEERARKESFPIVGPLAGRTLELLTRCIRAKRIFELGSGYGYSALFFARATGPDGAVHCTDFSEENVRLARDFLGRAGLWPRITYHQEEATAALTRVGGAWDIIYNDIDKERYPMALDLAYRHLRIGGLFISDNALWHGSVLSEERDDSAATEGIIEFTRRLFSHPGFLAYIDPCRDGLAIALKIS
jgi:caffeoyl-CoA O-methyltransferase